MMSLTSMQEIVH